MLSTLILASTLVAGPLGGASSALVEVDAGALTVRLAADVRASLLFTGPASSVFPGAAEARPQGDADGDGRADVLLASVESGRGGTRAVLRLVSSSAGERWSFASEATFVESTPGVDLDGDGLTDVLVFARSHDGTSRIDALRGLDGAPLWSIEGASESTVVGDKAADAGAKGGFPYAVFVGGDADGDGGADLWITRVQSDVEAGVAFGETVARVRPASLLRAEVRAGASGIVLSSVDFAVGPQGGGLALPAGDLDGDGRADTAVTIVPGIAPGAQVAAFAANGAQLWARPYVGTNALGVPVVDVDADGVADVLALLSAPASRALELLAGHSGEPRWRHDGALFLAMVPGDVDGDGGADVLMMAGEPRPGGTVVRAVMLAGASGAPVYDRDVRAVPLPENGWSSVEYETLAGDFDGDRALDTLLHVEIGVGEDVHLRESLLVRAADAGVAWVRAGPPARPVGDATGDGATDLALALPDRDGLVVTLVDGASGADAWSQLVGPYASARFLAPGHVGGDARVDAFATLAIEGGKEKGGGATVLAAWDGEGVPVWAPGGGK